MFSKSNHLNPYSTVNFKKTSKKKNDEEEEEEDDGGENDADDDPTNDAMIMVECVIIFRYLINDFIS